MVAIKTFKDPNQKGQKETLNHLNKNLEKLIKVLENKLPATTTSNNNLSKTEEAKRKKEEEQRRKEEKKQREEDLKVIKEALKNTIPAETRRDIGSTAIGSFTGINPVLVKTFGLDKLVQSIGVAAIHKVRSRVKSKREQQLEAEAGGAESNINTGEEQNSRSSLLGTTKKERKTNKLNQAANGNIITDKTDSAVEQNKQNQNPFKKGLDTIINLMKGKKKDGDKKEAEEKESWLKKLLKAGIFGLLLAGMLKAFGGVGSIIKDFMDSFFANTLGLGVAGVVISDMLPGALLGAKFGGLRGALVGGTISLAYFSIKRVVNDYKSRSDAAKEGVYQEAATLLGIDATTYAGMSLGAIGGFLAFGPVGVIPGAILGATGGWIVSKYLNRKFETSAKYNKARLDYEKRTGNDDITAQNISNSINQNQAQLNMIKSRTGITDNWAYRNLPFYGYGSDFFSGAGQAGWYKWLNDPDLKKRQAARNALKSVLQNSGDIKLRSEFLDQLNNTDINKKLKGDWLIGAHNRLRKEYRRREEYQEFMGHLNDFDLDKDGRITQAELQEFNKKGDWWSRQVSLESGDVTLFGGASALGNAQHQAYRILKERNKLKSGLSIDELAQSGYNLATEQALAPLETFDPTTEAREQKMKNDSLNAQETAANKLNELVAETKKTNEILNKQNGTADAGTGLFNWNLGFGNSNSLALNLKNKNEQTSNSLLD